MTVRDNESSAHADVAVDLHVVVEQGVNMASVSENLVDTVTFLLKKIADIEDVIVRVHIEGMRTH